MWLVDDSFHYTEITRHHSMVLGVGVKSYLDFCYYCNSGCVDTISLRTDVRMTQNDDRGIWPSASSFDRLSLCAGSFQLERDYPGPENAAAKRGTKIHAALEGKISWESLNKSDKISVERHAYNENSLIEQFSMEGSSLFKEKRFWVVGDDLEPRFSAQPDRVHIKDDRAMVLNYKNGRLPLKPIDKSWQIAVEVATVIANFPGIKTIIGGLIHPNAPKVNNKEHQTITWSRETVLVNTPTLIKVAEEAMKPDAIRVPGEEQCLYCSGRKCGICEKYRQWRNK